MHTLFYGLPVCPDIRTLGYYAYACRAHERSLSQCGACTHMRTPTHICTLYPPKQTSAGTTATSPGCLVFEHAGMTSSLYSSWISGVAFLITVTIAGPLTRAGYVALAFFAFFCSDHDGPSAYNTRLFTFFFAVIMTVPLCLSLSPRRCSGHCGMRDTREPLDENPGWDHYYLQQDGKHVAFPDGDTIQKVGICGHMCYPSRTHVCLATL